MIYRASNKFSSKGNVAYRAGNVTNYRLISEFISAKIIYNSLFHTN